MELKLIIPNLLSSHLLNNIHIMAPGRLPLQCITMLISCSCFLTLLGHCCGSFRFKFIVLMRGWWDGLVAPDVFNLNLFAGLPRYPWPPWALKGALLFCWPYRGITRVPRLDEAIGFIGPPPRSGLPSLQERSYFFFRRVHQHGRWHDLSLYSSDLSFPLSIWWAVPSCRSTMAHRDFKISGYCKKKESFRDSKMVRKQAV